MQTRRRFNLIASAGLLFAVAGGAPASAEARVSEERTSRHSGPASGLELPTDRDKLRSETELDPEHVALFGNVVSVSEGELVMDIFEPFEAEEGLEILSSESLPGMGLEGRRVTVTIPPSALIEVMDDDLAGLPPGTPIVVGGALSGNTLAARGIYDLRLAKPDEGTSTSSIRALPSGEAGTWEEVTPQEFVSPITPNLAGSAGPAPLQLDPQAGPVTLEFQGRYGGPAYEYYGDVPDTIVWPAPPVEVRAFRIVAGLLGWNYHFPFSFQANSPQPLVAGENATVSLLVQPTRPPGNASSFYGGLGINLTVYGRVWFLTWFDYAANLNLLSMINSTQDPAPMPGQTLDVPDTACAGLTLLGVPGVPMLSVATLGLCNSFIFTGDYFYADVSTLDGVISPPADNLAFDGTNALAITVTPSADPLRLRVDDFRYSPYLSYGLTADLKIIVLGKVWESPPVTLKSGEFSAVPPDRPGVCPLFSFQGTCGVQPTSLNLTLPLSRPFTLALNGPGSVTEGATAMFTFTATSPDGDPVSWAPGYPTCGEKAVLLGNPQIEDGHFLCYFPDGPATSTVSIKVRDSHGEESSVVSSAVAVVNVPPSLRDIAVTSPVTENDIATLSSAIRDPGKADSFTLEADWGDGSAKEAFTLGAATTSFTLKHQYLDDSPSGLPSDPYTIALSISDKDGGTGAAFTTITVNNADPVVRIDNITDETGAAIGRDVGVSLVGLKLAVAGSFTDVGTLDTHRAWVEWGDGSTSDLGDVSGALTVAHTFTRDGDDIITLRVRDDDSGEGVAARGIKIVRPAGGILGVIEELLPHRSNPDVSSALSKLMGNNNGEAANSALAMLKKGNLNAALEKIKQALQALEAAEATDPDLDLTHVEALLALCGKSVTVSEIARLENVARGPKDYWRIAQAKALVVQGDSLLAGEDYVGAVGRYQEALRKVQGT